MPEFECYPTWIFLNDSIFEPVDFETLPLSAQLKNQLRRWDAAYQAIYDRANPTNSGFKNSANEIEFDAEGKRILNALQSELIDYDVVYYK